MSKNNVREIKMEIAQGLNRRRVNKLIRNSVIVLIGATLVGGSGLVAYDRYTSRDRSGDGQAVKEQVAYSKGKEPRKGIEMPADSGRKSESPKIYNGIPDSLYAQSVRSREAIKIERDSAEARADRLRKEKGELVNKAGQLENRAEQLYRGYPVEVQQREWDFDGRLTRDSREVCVLTLSEKPSNDPAALKIRLEKRDAFNSSYPGLVGYVKDTLQPGGYGLLNVSKIQITEIEDGVYNVKVNAEGRTYNMKYRHPDLIRGGNR